MSRRVEFYLVDIFIAADKIARYTSKFENPKSFLHSELEWDATIRELEVIGEATNRLLQQKFLGPEHRVIVDFRNQIAHGYFGVDEEIVWEVATVHLDEYLQSLEELISAGRIDLHEAVECAKKDHYYSEATLQLLNRLSAEN